MKSKLLFLMLVIGLALAGPVKAEMLISADWEGEWADYSPQWWTWGSGDGPSGWGSFVSSGGVDNSQYMELDATMWSSWGWLMVGTNKTDGSTGEAQIACTPGQVLEIDGYAKHVAGGTGFWGLLEWQDHTGYDVDYDGDGLREGPGTNPDNADDRSGLTFTLVGTGDWERIYTTYTVPTLDLLGGTIDPPITHFIVGWGVSVGQTIGFDNLSVSVAGVINIYPPDGSEYIPIDAVLEWARPESIDPNAYDVYFTTDPNCNDPCHLVVDGVLQTTYDPPGDLAFNTEYYWRVNMYDANCTESCEWPKEGPVWSFKTMPAEPVFTTDSEHVVVATGGSAVFSVVSPNADSFQWYKDPCSPTAVNHGDDGGDVSVVSDATSSTLTIDNVEAADEKFYYCAATNIYDTTDSADAKLAIAKLLAHWKLDSPLLANHYKDETGNHHADPNKYQEVSFTDGIVGGALGAVEMNNFRWANAGNWRPNEYGNQMTVSAWFKIPDTNDITGDGPGIVSKRVGTSLDWSLYVRGGDPGHPGDNYVRFSSWNTGDLWAGPDAVPENPDWVFAAGTVDGAGEGRLYVNGVLQAVDDEWTFGTNVGADILIGKGTPEQYVFPGMIDDVKIYNYARDSYEIAADYTDVAGGSVCAENFPGDYNGDCKVDLADAAELFLIWQNCNLVESGALVCP